MMDKLWCEDVLSDILCRISVKELSRFKCVCKSWHLLIDQVCIPRIYTPSTLAGLYIPTRPFPPEDEWDRPPYKNKKYEYASLSLLQEDGHGDEDGIIGVKIRSGSYRLLDCCNGLLLFVSKSKCLQLRQYYVFNRTIKQWFDIPKGLPSFYESSTVFVCAALAFDPSESPHYKLIQFSRIRTYPIILDVFSSQTQLWVRRELPVDILDNDTRGIQWSWASVYLNGVFYRLSDTRHLLRIDINLLKASILSVPREEKPHHTGCIGLLMGRLSYAEYVADRSKIKLFIWSLEHDDGTTDGKWVLNYNICVKELRWHVLINMQHPQCIVHWFEPYAFGPNSDIIYFGTNRMIVSYHLKTKRIEEVFRTADDMTCHSPVLVVT